MADLQWACLKTPVGIVSVGCSAVGVARVRFGAPPASAGGGLADAAGPGAAAAGPGTAAAGPGAAAAGPGTAAALAGAARDALGEYFCGQRRHFGLPIDWSGIAGPQRHVLAALAGTVGYGQTTSYGALAARAGLTAAAGEMPPARAVGRIMAANPIPVIVPCHRVLAGNGIGGYSGGAGVEVKRWLLILEGSLPPTLDWQPATRCPSPARAAAPWQWAAP